MTVNLRERMKNEIADTSKYLVTIQFIYNECDCRPEDPNEEIVRELENRLVRWFEASDEFIDSTYTDAETKELIENNRNLVRKAANYYSNYEQIGKWYCFSDYRAINSFVREYLTPEIVEEWVQENYAAISQIIEDFRKHYSKEVN